MATDRAAFPASDGVLHPALPSNDSRPPVRWPLVLVGGLLGGLAWGAFARAWMRFITTDPEFTWNGTLFVVGGFGVAGLAQAGAYLGRRADLGRPRMTALRVVTFAGLMPLGMAAGGPMFPTVVLAPLVLTHTEWSCRTRLILGAMALIPIVAVAGILLDGLSIPRAAFGFLWFLVVYAGIVWAARFTLAPQRDGWRAPKPVRIVAMVGLLLAAVLETVFLVGPRA